MLSEKIADLSEMVLGEEAIPEMMRAHFAALLADYAEQARALEDGGGPFVNAPFTAQHTKRCGRRAPA